MFGLGLLSGLIAKLAGLGSVAKVALGTTTAALTMAAAAAGGVLPVGGGDTGPAVVESALEAATVVAPATDAVATASGPTGVETSIGASVTAPTGSTSAVANAGAAVTPSAVSIPPVSIPPVSIPLVPGVGAVVPDLSGLTQIPTQVLACLAPVLDLVTGLPTVSPRQITQIGTSVVGCVTELVRGLPLPAGLSACISNILGFVNSITSQLPTGVPSVGDLNVAACIPTGLPVPTGLFEGLPFMGGGFPFVR